MRPPSTAVIALMTVLPVSKQLFPQSALFEHRGEQHLLLLEERHAVKVSPVVNLLREVCYTGPAFARAANRAGEPLRALLPIA